MCKPAIISEDGVRSCKLMSGTGIGVAMIIVLWFIVFVVLSLIWLMTRPSKRACPACGEDVKKGRTKCKSCGHDFAAVATPAVASTQGATAP